MFSEPQLTEKNDCTNCQRLVDSIKEKLTDCSNYRKMKMLTLASKDWTIQKTMEFFNVSEHAVKQARKLKKEKGILATPSNYYREGLNKKQKNVLLNSMREMMPIVCVQVKKTVLTSETKMVQKRRFKCFFVDTQQVDVVAKFLTYRYENARQLRAGRKNHQFISNGGNILLTQISGVDFPVSNLTEDSPASIIIEEVIPQEFYVCHYEKDWYFGIANYVSIENNDVNVKSMHPKGTASKFVGPVGMTFTRFLLKILYVK